MKLIVFCFSVTKSWHPHGIYIPSLVYSNVVGIPNYEQPRIFANSASFPQKAAVYWYGRNIEEVFQFYEFDCISKLINFFNEIV